MRKVLNKKAFTLTELIATIVILSILITLSVVVFVNIRRSALETEYSNLVSYLETKGIEYANSTNITTISVEDLIKEGYVKPDDESDIYNPINKTSLNCYLIKMEFKDGEYVAKFSENSGRNEDGTCKEYTKTSDFKICIVNGNDCEEIVDNEWFGNDVTLRIKYRDTLLSRSDANFNWLTNTGYSSEEDTVSTDVKLISDVIYKCEVIFGEVTGVAIENIKIDKEKPVISEVKVDTNWSTTKIIEIVASDGIGSGIKGYFVEGITSDYQSSNKIEVKKDDDYKIYVKDNAGNVSDVKIVKVEKIDSGKPTITRKGDEFQILVGEDKHVLSEYFVVTYSDSGGTTTCDYERTKDLTVGSYNLACTVVGGNGLTASDSITLKVLPRTPSTPVVEVKYTDDTGSAYSGDWTNKNLYFKLTPGKSSDIVTVYQYKIGNGSWSTPSWLSMTGNSGGFVYSSEVENTIYIRACNGNDCSNSTSGIALKIDKTAPTCNLSISSSRISMGTKSSDVTKSGVNKSSTPSYTSTYQSIGTGTFYGHVYDRAGNTGTCNLSVTSTSSSSSSYSCSYDCGYWTEPSCSYVCYRYMTASEKAKGKCSGSATEGAYNTCWRWHSSSSCSSSYPYLDSSGTSCSGSSVYVSQTCYKTCYETTYYCQNGYSKLNNSYCYK